MIRGVLLSRLQTVTVQDVTLFILCALAIYLLRVQEVHILQPEWRRDFNTKHYRNRNSPSDEEILPRPVITDLDSDGVTEIVLITNEMRLEVLALPDGNEHGILPHLEVKNSTQLPTHGKYRPVAMETGFIHKYRSTVQGRKQIIVIILNNWSILCFNHHLELLWQQQLIDMLEREDEYVVKSMGILISPEKLMRTDDGVIIVGGAAFHREHSHRKRKLKADELQRSDRVMSETGRPRRNTPIHYLKPRGKEEDTSEATMAGEDAFTHFSTFALSGNNGTLRWHHLPGDFESKPKMKHEPHHWKLALKKANMHQGEISWKQFSQGLFKQMVCSPVAASERLVPSILAELVSIFLFQPYVWSHLQDTRFELAQLHKNSEPKMAGIRVPEKMEETSIVPDIFGLPTEHLLGFAYGGLRPHSRHEHVTNPNAVVMHNHLGMEVLSLSAGQPLTRLHVDEEKVVYADVNQDGTLERVAVNYDGDNCHAEVTSLPPDLRVLYTGTLCEPPTWWASVSLAALFINHRKISENTKVAVPPTVVKSIASTSGPFQHLLGHALPSRRSGYDCIFLTSTGRLTSFGPTGHFNWQVHVDSNWMEVAELSLSGLSSASQTVQFFNTVFKPSVTAFSRQLYGKETLALLVGWSTLEVVDLSDGRVWTHHSLPCQPITTPVIGDFNNDGRNDFIIACSSGYLGFSLDSQCNYLSMSAVAVSVILAILLLTWCFKPEEGRLD